MEQVKTTVVVCTFNRSAMLADTLQSWRGVQGSDDCVELLVVDNASTDDTPKVVQRFQRTFTGCLRYVHEPRAGLSHARNRGISEARGGIIAFVDDDVYFHPGWLASVRSAFRSDPQVHCIGGRSVPTFEVEAPAWLSQRMLKFYGSTESGDEPRRMVFPEHPFGVNMAFRREVFDIVGGFRPDLGRKGTSLLSDEEKEFFYRIASAKLEVLYVPDAIIRHRVPADRVDPDWLLRRAYWQGVSSVVFDKHVRRHTRLRLLRNVYRSSRALLLGSERRSLRGIYDWHRGLDINARMHRHTLLGVIRQSAIELIRPAHTGSNLEGRP